MGKKTEAKEVNTEHTVLSRVSVLEHNTERLEQRVDAGFSEMSKSLRSLSEQIQSKGAPLPIREIAGTALATAALVTYILTAMNGWFDQRAAPMAITIQRLAEQDKNGELAVLKHRVLLLERMPNVK